MFSINLNVFLFISQTFNFRISNVQEHIFILAYFLLRDLHKEQDPSTHRLKPPLPSSLHRSLRHENVVQFFKHFEDGDNIYIMLENCSRKSLVHVLKSRVTVTEPETRYYMTQLVQGVEYIHSQNISTDQNQGSLFLTHNRAVKIGLETSASPSDWARKRNGELGLARF